MSFQAMLAWQLSAYLGKTQVQGVDGRFLLGEGLPCGEEGFHEAEKVFRKTRKPSTRRGSPPRGEEVVCETEKVFHETRKIFRVTGKASTRRSRSSARQGSLPCDAEVLREARKSSVRWRRFSTRRGRSSV
jgi:hypothetical protein